MELPGSKSITARALFLAAAADGQSTLVDPLVSDDTEAFVEGLGALGCTVEQRATVGGGAEWFVDGSLDGPPRPSADVFTRDGATTSRCRSPSPGSGSRV